MRIRNPKSFARPTSRCIAPKPKSAAHFASSGLAQVALRLECAARDKIDYAAHVQVKMAVIPNVVAAGVDGFMHDARDLEPLVPGTTGESKVESTDSVFTQLSH